MALDYDLENTHASRMLKAIELVLEGKASKDIQMLEMNGRKISHFSHEELRSLRSKYLREYRQDLVEAGHLPRSNKIKTRFV
ncbi:hypothetical protein [Thiomicrorhabdus lithotrophica]|uniref:GpW protein n=1 Tax=Thiomicrorhabdus lithotrophica TaxID=2949997 RepID=A0ABY8CC85_9GAMM|nr:hypothetical protein [Thiomicrorhabdus lithotrophica]WEJ62161.1 hypothetical protein NR989_09085 [Thiomicrorhabdus lithotrophica]